ncbi:MULTISPECIES: hypothetical protein [Frankia]|uniref:hypothetical protein n=1 Tax=Frankia TaxID=1854 RepID=UPI0005A55295|nr:MULTISPECIES: hypothetical protein [Frankia]
MAGEHLGGDAGAALVGGVVAGVAVEVGGAEAGGQGVRGDAVGAQVTRVDEGDRVEAVGVSAEPPPPLR